MFKVQVGAKGDIVIKPPSCEGCPLRSTRSGFSKVRQPALNGVLIVTDYPTESDLETGTLFRPGSESSAVLDRVLKMAGYKLDQFGLGSLLSCRPPKGELANTPYEGEAVAHCVKRHLGALVDALQPQVVVALGSLVSRHLTGLGGKKLTLDFIRGYAVDSVFTTEEGAAIPVICTYHPSMIRRGAWQNMPVLVNDIRKAVALARAIRGYGVTMPAQVLDYVEHGQPGDLETMRDMLRANPDVPVSVDVETDYGEVAEVSMEGNQETQIVAVTRPETIIQLNFSTLEKTALVVPVGPEHIGLIRDIHALPNAKIGHNIVMYDKWRCLENNMPFSGSLEDTMWMFHWIYPDLPQGWKKDKSETEDGTLANLQFCASFAGFPFPWKHLGGSRPEFYGGCDADAALRVYWWVSDVMEQLGTNVVNGYYSMVAELFSALDAMTRRGIPVRRENLIEMRKYLAGRIAEIKRKVHEVVPVELRPLQPAMGLLRAPKGVYQGQVVEITKKAAGGDQTIEARMIEILVDLPAEKKICCMKARKPLKKTGEVAPKYLEHPKGHWRDGVWFAPVPDCPKCGGGGVLKLEARTERRWTRELPFNAGSSDQMMAYAEYRGYEIPKNSKREISMDAETVEKMARKYKDQLFNLRVELLKLDKMDGTYCAGWMPGEDGLVHPRIGPYPGSGQLSSRGPNAQNVPNVSKQGELAVLFRKALWGGSCDRVVVELDMKSFHVQTLGYEAQDPIYIGLASTDIHSFFAVTGLLKLENRDKLLSEANANLSKGLRDPELAARLKWYRKNYTLKNGQPFDFIRDKQAKVAVLAYGLGMGDRTLYLKNEDSFKDLAEATAALAAMDRTFEKEKAYRDKVPAETKRNGYKRINRFGFVRWFFALERYNPRTRMMEWRGDEREAAIAFDVQASAHGHMRVIIKELEASGLAERFVFDNTVHDSFRFRPLKSELEECINLVKPVCEQRSAFMPQPWADGLGLGIGVEAKWGLNWGEMEEWKG